VTTSDLPERRDDAAPRTAGLTPRPHAGTWNTRTEPVSAAPAHRYDPFAALGHEASRHGHTAHGTATGRDGGPAHSLWPHADEHPEGYADGHADGRAEVTDERRTAWSPHATWRPTPSVPFPRPAPSTETDPPAWA